MNAPEQPPGGTRPPPPTVLVNLAVTFVSRFWMLGLAIGCTPVYVHRLGPAGYGLVGLFLAVQRVAVLLDAGLSQAIKREMAALGRDTTAGSADSHAADARSAADLFRTLELIFWALCGACFAVVACGGGWLAGAWGAGLANDAPLLLLVMAAAIAAQLPHGFYSGVLVGQQRHATLSVVNMAWHGLRLLGAAAVLTWVSATPLAFFLWQLACGVLVTSASAVLARRSGPLRGVPARFDWRRFRSVAPYAAGGTLSAITAAVMTQMDKLIIWQQASADDFGHYAIAGSLAGVLFVLISPVQAVMFPRLAGACASEDHAGLARCYHAGSQLAAVVTLPAAVTGVLFSGELIWLWLGDREIAARSAPIASLLFAGVGLNCLSSMPFALQMACGWTRLVNQLSVAAVVLFAPLIYAACSRYGMVAAAAVWPLFAGSYLAAQVVAMHRRLLPRELYPWVGGLALAACCAAAPLAALRALLAPESRLACAAVVAAGYAASLAATTLASPALWRRARGVVPAAGREPTPERSRRAA
ncbi:MAG: oligosaccharide flippase family protein [Planctomycetota bacterium]